MEFLNNILENSQLPLVSAFVLGIMTAISPCPMATNITAIGYIGKDIENKSRVFFNGIIYTAGRALSYTSLGAIFYFSAGQFKLTGFLQEWGERALGPILIIIGLFMLGIIKLNIPFFSNFTNNIKEKTKHSFWDVLLLGVLFALAFCPYSGVLFFGMLIPLTISSVSGLYLPIVFAIATGIPVIVFAWILAFSIGSLSKIYNGMKKVEIWFRRVVAIAFIGVGIYYVTLFFI